MFTLSCRSSFATIFSGWLSRQRPEKYRLVSSKKIHRLLQEVLDGQRGLIDRLVEPAVDLQRPVEANGAKRDPALRVAGDDGGGNGLGRSVDRAWRRDRVTLSRARTASLGLSRGRGREGCSNQRGRRPRLTF
jgi:hypothetical protein